MTASEHLNPDLFLRVYHSSDLPIGPHERSSEKYAKGIAGGHIVNPWQVSVCWDQRSGY